MASLSICLLHIALYGASFASAQQDELPASFGPPEDSDPLSWGFYATHEVREPTQLEIEGEIPDWVTGSLYRGAAATWDVGNYTSEHWFDGFSRNHRFEIAKGAVTYRSRNGSDELMEIVRETGLYPGGSFGGDPCKIIFGGFETTYRDGLEPAGDKSSANVGVAYAPNFAGLARNKSGEDVDPFDTLVMGTDGNELQQLDPDTLEPIELFTYQASDPLLVNGGRSAAHPVVDKDGTIFNYVLDLDAGPPVYRVFSINPPTGETKIMANITDAPPAYIHSMFATEKHIILIIWQADLVNPGVFTILDAIGDWDESRHALFYVMDRETGKLVRKYEADHAFFAFHEINSFENENGDIFIDLPRMNDASFLYDAKMENLRANLGSHDSSSWNDLAASFTRFRLPYHPPACRRRGEDDAAPMVTYDAEVDFTIPFEGGNIELPRINPEYAGKPYRYAYGIHSKQQGYFADSIIKVDTGDQSVKVWTPETRHLPSEPIFAKRPGGEGEDDGLLLTVVMSQKEKRSSLVFLDAVTLEEIARAKMPIVMGYGFHGAWGTA